LSSPRSASSSAAATLVADFLAPYDIVRSNDGGARALPQIDRRLIFFQRSPIHGTAPPICYRINATTRLLPALLQIFFHHVAGSVAANKIGGPRLVTQRY